MQQYTVAVSGINATDNPGPGTGIAKSLKKSDLDIRVVGIAYDAMEPGPYMDWVIDKSYIIPYPSAGQKVFLERFKEIHAQEKIDVFISALDSEYPILMSIKEELEKLGVKILLPTAEAYRQRDKKELPKVAQDLGVKVPETKVLSEVKHIKKAVDDLGLPMMIKGPFYEAAKVTSFDEAIKKFLEISFKWGYPILAQKFIQGEEYNLIGLSNSKSEDLGHVSIKKILITKQGKVWTNVSIKNNRIEKVAENLLKNLNWVGGYELELLEEKKSGDLYLIEINPRFPAWIYMATGCGINLPDRMIKELLGLPYDTHSNYPAGKVMIRYTDEVIRDMSDVEQLTLNAEL